jgi:transposase
VPGDEQPSQYEVLAALVASLRPELAEAAGALKQARAELARARERIAELEARLKQNPRNSSRPPSSEGLAKPAPRPRSLRKRSGRKPGGQDGHKGTTLAQVDRPDWEIRHEPGCCGRCGAGLAGRPVTGVERRQVFDLLPVRAEVTEHQLIERECGCGHRTKAAAPAGAEAPVQYGPRIAAIIVYLYAGQFLSKERTALALGELFGIPCSSGTVAALTACAAGWLDGFLEQVCAQIAASEVAGFDETGFRVAGRLAWVHCARTGKYTLLTVHSKRGRQAIQAMGILPRFAGSPSTMPGPHTTPTRPGSPVVLLARPARTASRRRRRAARPVGAGPRRPPRLSPRCRSWCARRSARDATPWTRPRWPPRSTCSDPRCRPGPPRPPPASGLRSRPPSGSTYSTSTLAHSAGPPARAASSAVIRVTLRRDEPLDSST